MRAALLLLLFFLVNVEARRRRPWTPREKPRVLDEEKTPTSVTTTPASKEESPATTTASKKEDVSSEREIPEDKRVIDLLNEGALDVRNLTRLVEEEYAASLGDALNKTVLWIDATFKAFDFGLNVSQMEECQPWMAFFENLSNTTDEDPTGNSTDEGLSNEELVLKEYELIDTSGRLRELGLNDELLDAYSAVGIVYREICANREREFWYKATEDARALGIDASSPICTPFKEELNPNAKKLHALALLLNEIIHNVTSGLMPPLSATTKSPETSTAEVSTEPTTTLSDWDEFAQHLTDLERNSVVSLSDIEERRLEEEERRRYYEEEASRRPHVFVATPHPFFREGNSESSPDPLRRDSGPSGWRGDSSASNTPPPVTRLENVEMDPLRRDGDYGHGDNIPSTTSTSHREREQADQLDTFLYQDEPDPQLLSALPAVLGHGNTISEDTFAQVHRKAEERAKELLWQEEQRRIRRQKAEGEELHVGVTLRLKRKTEDEVKKEEKEKRRQSAIDNDEDWLGEIASEEEDGPHLIVDDEPVDNATLHFGSWVEIDATDENNPTLLLASQKAAHALGLAISEDLFTKYEKVVLYLPGICADYVPSAVDEFNSSAFEGVEIEGPIGVNISALEAAGVNLTELAEKLRNDTEVDDILSRTNHSIRTLGGSFILPVLNKNQYDPFSAPIVFQGSAVVVRFGIYIESMSNFQSSTMDYDMDIYLMMAWRDARLVNPYEKPILVKEEEILEKIWRPDPFFANAKEAEFHEVTFLNFLMRVFPDGLVLYETRIKLKPACNLVLCKYPHDKQTCELIIKSFAYATETVRFEWFSRKVDAIDKNPEVKLPELYIDRYEPTTCNKTRKSGSFSCLRAVFRLKRDVGFHIAQTYIPTSLALMFSWVGVWLPEEFMEGRIGVAITVLLTLSTESAGAREHLPSVSYLKAIDLWFGFITGFCFFTLLQTLFVIGFDKRAGQLRKWATKKKTDATQEARDAIILKANRYHKTGRYLDNFCRVFYPLSFVMFLIMYYFVFTEGRQDDCISR